MKDTAGTYESGKQIARLFYEGREVSELWFEGDRVFKLGGGGGGPELIETNLPFTISGSRMMRMGDYIVLFEAGPLYSSKNFHRFKDGAYIDTVTYTKTADASTAYFYPDAYEAYGFVVIHEIMKSGENRLYTYAGGDSLRYITLSSTFTGLRPSANFQTGVYCNNRLFLGHIRYQQTVNYSDVPLFDADDRRHCRFVSVSIVLNEKKEPVAEEVSYHYGIDKNTDVSQLGTYNLKNPIIVRMAHDTKTGIFYADLITALVTKLNERGLVVYELKGGAYMIGFDGVLATKGGSISEEGTKGWDRAITSFINSPVTIGNYVRYQNVSGGDGYLYNTVLRNDRDYIINNLLSIPVDLTNELVWVPGKFIAYDEKHRKYYIATPYNGASNLKTYDGILRSGNIDDGNIPVTAQHPEYEFLFDAPQINGFITCNANDDGFYMYFYDMSGWDMINKLYYIPFNEEEVEDEEI